MAVIKFAFYNERHSKTGNSWAKFFTTPEVLLEQVTVTTKAQITKVEEVVEPLLIPMGCESRTAQLQGFFANSLTYNQGLDTNIDVVDVRSEEPMGRAMAVVSGSELVPELGTAKWRIKTFTWDRMANKLGQYHFSMEVSYVWEVENEIQLFADGINTKKHDNVKFTAQKIGGSSRPIYNTSVIVTNKDLNSAKFSTYNKEFEKDDKIQIYSSTHADPFFYGIVKEVKNNKDGTYQTECIEIGDILNRKLCARTGAGLFKPRIKISNPYKGNNLTVEQMTKIIMQFYNSAPIYGYNPGWGIPKGSGDFAQSEYMPGKKTYIPPQVLSGMSIGKALTTFLTNQCGLSFWFTTKDGLLEYGFVRDPITLDPEWEFIEYNEKVEGNSTEYDVDYVVVHNNAGNDFRYGGNASGGGKMLQYKLNTDLLDRQLQEYADRVYQDLKVNDDTYRMTFQAGTVRFREGDYFTALGDLTLSTPMPYRDQLDTNPTDNPGDSVWQIKEMIISETKTEVIVGSSYYSIFDIYKDSLKRCDGVPAPTDDVTKNGTWVAVGVNETTLESTS